MLSRKPKASRIVGSTWQSCCQTGVTPPISRSASRARSIADSRRCASGATAAKATWTSGVPSGRSQCSGLLSPVSPSNPARAAIPCWNSSAKLSSESCGTPRAFKPWNVSATLTHASPAGLVAWAAEATAPWARRINARPAARSSMRTRRYVAA